MSDLTSEKGGGPARREISRECGFEVRAITRDRWRVSPWFLVRMTGFPMELIGGLRLPETASRVQAILSASGSREDTVKALAQVRSVFDRELADAVAVLRRLASLPNFREAVFLSNPANFSYIDRWITGAVTSPSKDRQGVLSCSMYLQRFCMKNDTASFFGPSFWGVIAPYAEAFLDFSFDPTPKFRRAVFFTHWATNEIARWASKLPGAGSIIRPRPVPTMSLSNGRARGIKLASDKWEFVDVPCALPQGAEDVLTYANGEYSVAELCQLFQAVGELLPGGLEPLLDALVEANLIHASLEVPAGIFQPMEYIEKELRRASLREAHLIVTELLKLRDAFQAEDLEGRERVLALMNDLFRETTGKEATRGAGKFHADRSIIYEDATRNFSRFVIGRRLLNDILQLPAILDLLWKPTETDETLTHEAVVGWFRRRFPSQQRIPFLDYTRAFLEDRGELEPSFRKIAATAQDVARQIFRRLVPSEDILCEVVEHDLCDIERFTKDLGGRGSSGVMANPDILVAAKSYEALQAGNYQIILGELHADRELLSHSPVACFLSQDGQELLRHFVSRHYATAVWPDEIVADVVRMHVRKTHAQLLLDGPDVETDGLSPKPRRQVLALKDLDVVLAAGLLRLYSPLLDRFIRLTVARVPSGSLGRASPLKPFAFPTRDGVLPLPHDISYSPRVVVGRIVLLRRMWRVLYDERYDPLARGHSGWQLDLFVEVHRLKRDLRLPDRVFAKIEGERKPVFVDFSSYFLVHAFCKLWSQHQGAVTLTEVYPDIDDSWLTDEEGRYGCELRMGLYRRASWTKGREGTVGEGE